MTKKDCQEVARVIGWIENKTDRKVATKRMILHCQADNPRFDMDRFIDAVNKSHGQTEELRNIEFT